MNHIELVTLPSKQKDLDTKGTQGVVNYLVLNETKITNTGDKIIYHQITPHHGEHNEGSIDPTDQCTV